MKNRTVTAILISTALCLAASGCASGTAANATTTAAGITAPEETTASETTAVETEASTTGKTYPATDDSSSEPAVSAVSPGQDTGSDDVIVSDTVLDIEPGKPALNTSDMFGASDLEQTADMGSAQTITAEDGQEITISEEGVYLIKGSAKNCTITVDAESKATVRLVLDGVSITNDDFPAIYVVSAEKCIITTTGSENTLSVTGEFRSDSKTDAVIFSKEDIVLNGTGTLNINCTEANAVTGKAGVKITGGTYGITSGKQGIKAKDLIAVNDGSLTIKCGKDGFHCENDDDGSVGSIYISGGNFGITASDDGIQATAVLQIDGGTFVIEAAEGLEASYVQINGGIINISASDDGINASQKTTAITTPTIEFNGGEVTIVMGEGDTDGVDSNGNIYVNGGTINVTGQSTFDFDGEGKLNGGTVIVNGEQVSELPTQTFGAPGGFPGAPNGKNGFPGAPGGKNGFPEAPNGENGFPGAPNGENGFPGAPNGENGFPGAQNGGNGFPGAPNGENGFPGAPNGENGFPGARNGENGFPGAPNGENGFFRPDGSDTVNT